MQIIYFSWLKSTIIPQKWQHRFLSWCSYSVQCETSLNTFHFIILMNSIRRLQNKNSKIGPKKIHSVLPCFLSMFWKVENKFNSKEWQPTNLDQFFSSISGWLSTVCCWHSRPQSYQIITHENVQIITKPAKSDDFWDFIVTRKS